MWDLTFTIDLGLPPQQFVYLWHWMGMWYSTNAINHAPNHHKIVGGTSNIPEIWGLWHPPHTSTSTRHFLPTETIQHQYLSENGQMPSIHLIAMPYSCTQVENPFWLVNSQCFCLNPVVKSTFLWVASPFYGWRVIFHVVVVVQVAIFEIRSFFLVRSTCVLCWVVRASFGHTFDFSFSLKS